MTANRNSGRTLTNQQTNTFADALSNGINAASKSTSEARGAGDSTADPDADPSSSLPTYQVLNLKTNATAAVRNITDEMLARVALNKQHGEARARAHVPPKQRRRLLAAGTNNKQPGAAGGANSTAQRLKPLEAFTMLESGMFNLTAAQSIVLGGAARAAGNAAVCVAPALLPQRAVDGFNITFDCPGITVPAQVGIHPLIESCLLASTN